jgi:CHAT domain-containing protein
MLKSSKLFVFVIMALLAGGLLVARAPLAEVLFEEGLRAKKEWRLEAAIRYFEWARRLRRDQVRARFEIGMCHQLRGEFLASQREFDELMAEPVEDLTLRAQLLNAVGVNHFNMNEPDAAIERHQQSLELARQLDDRRLQAQALIDLSRVLYYSKGQTDKALSYLQQALRMGRALPDELIEADALRNIGVIYWWHQGEADRPLSEYYEPALEICRRQNDLRSAAITLSNIGLIHGNKGDLYQFMKYQNESLELKHRIGDLAGLSDSYSFLGQMYSGIGNYRKARGYYSKSLELSRRIGYQLTQNEVENHLAIVYINLGEFDEAIDLLHRLFERERENPLLAKYRLTHLAHCYLFKGEPALARQHFERALEMERDAPDPRSTMGILTRLGETYMALGDWQKASETLAQAEEVGLVQKEKLWGEEVHHHLVLAELMERQGQRDEALKFLLEAAEIETQVFGSTETQFVQGQYRQLYDRLFTLLLDNSGTIQNPKSKIQNQLAFRVLEQLRYRSFRNFVVRLSEKRSDPRPPRQEEMAAISRIEQVSRKSKSQPNPSFMKQLRRAYSDYEDLVLRTELATPRYQRVRQARPAEVEEVQRVLDPETALVEYLFAGEKVFALVITRSTLRSAILPVTKPNLAAKVKLFRSLMFNPQSRADWQPVADDLRRVLIEPLEQSGALSGIRRLGLVPYGFLHDLPFAALARIEGEEVTFLVEDYAIFYVPSATFLKHAKSSDQRPTTNDRTMLSFGKSQSDEPEWPPLRFAEEEARAVVQIFNGQVRVNTRANETELKQLAPNFLFIHLATHAVSEPLMPLLSRLHLQSTGEDDGRFTVREIFDLNLQAELVTLGACRTGLSFSSSGNELIEVDRLGLIEAFLYAGAKSVLASLLPIDDRSTLEFMKAFYENLRSMDKTEALAHTQRAMLRGELGYIENNQPHHLTHPRYWAPFILVGEYR